MRETAPRRAVHSRRGTLYHHGCGEESNGHDQKGTGAEDDPEGADRLSPEQHLLRVPREEDRPSEGLSTRSLSRSSTTSSRTTFTSRSSTTTCSVTEVTTSYLKKAEKTHIREGRLEDRASCTTGGESATTSYTRRDLRRQAPPARQKRRGDPEHTRRPTRTRKATSTWSRKTSRSSARSTSSCRRGTAGYSRRAWMLMGYEELLMGHRPWA